jgi:hypothetical protein
MGNISSLNGSIDIPFDFKRLFYLYDVPGGESRGGHAHKHCHQLLIAGSGSFEVYVCDGLTSHTYFLNTPSQGLHIPPGVWASEKKFSSGTVCLVLASHIYEAVDYIRDFDDYKKYNR